MDDIVALPYGNIMELFKKLTEKEVAEYKQWTWNNYKPLTEIKGVWHPIIQEECRKMNIEAAKNIDGLPSQKFPR